MEQIVVEIKDKAKAKVLIELLSSLDFVTSVTTQKTMSDIETETSPDDDPVDFFSLVGIWKDRDITLDSLREQAWPQKHS